MRENIYSLFETRRKYSLNTTFVTTMAYHKAVLKALFYFKFISMIFLILSNMTHFYFIMTRLFFLKSKDENSLLKKATETLLIVSE